MVALSKKNYCWKINKWKNSFKYFSLSLATKNTDTKKYACFFDKINECKNSLTARECFKPHVCIGASIWYYTHIFLSMV